MSSYRIVSDIPDQSSQRTAYQRKNQKKGKGITSFSMGYPIFILSQQNKRQKIRQKKPKKKKQKVISKKISCMNKKTHFSNPAF
jgi:hypothetical protein